MKTRFIFLLLMLPTLLISQSFDYQGIGIFKAKQGDTITIIPEKAYIINQDIFDAGLRAFEYVDSNTCDVQLEVWQERARYEEKAYQELAIDYDSCLLKRQLLINQFESKVDTLILLNNRQKEVTEAVKSSVAEKDKLIDKLHKRVRRRTYFAGAAFVAWIVEKGIVFFSD